MLSPRIVYCFVIGSIFGIKFYLKVALPCHITIFIGGGGAGGGYMQNTLCQVSTQRYTPDLQCKVYKTSLFEIGMLAVFFYQNLIGEGFSEQYLPQ